MSRDIKNEDLKKLISQIKKYDLTKSFRNTDDFDEWLSRLSFKQIRNFNSLNIDVNEIMFPISLLIDENLLNCDDYTKRVEVMSKLKNGDSCWHLFDRLCSVSFLRSKNYYKDMEMISKASTARYALWVVDEDIFINSPYHDEDLKLIVEAKDTKGENDFIVAEALAMVACDERSIRSPYHRKDMELISKCGSDCLQMSHSYPEHSLNNLAINEISLNDKYHLENMQILAQNIEIDRFLYNIMTKYSIVTGKYYREEISALINAKSKITARAIYYYITSPDEIMSYDVYDELNNLGLDYNDIYLLVRFHSYKKKNLDPKYLDYLKLLNLVDDRFVLYIEALLSNEDFLNSKYVEMDLNLLLSVTDKDIFMDLFRVMSDENSLNSDYHQHDVFLISQTRDNEIRNLLTVLARNKASVNSINHEFDMKFVAKLDLKSIKEERYSVIRYYLTNPLGINNEEHRKILERLSYNQEIDDIDPVSKYLDSLERGIDDSNYSGDRKDKNNALLKIRALFKRR